jgi:hypothetical protein
MTTGADWAEQARHLLDALRAAPGEATEEAGHASGECRWCPHCQVLAFLRGERPEVAAVLGDVLATASAALRTLAGENESPTPPSAGDDGAAHGDPAPVAQRIEIA